MPLDNALDNLNLKNSNTEKEPLHLLLDDLPLTDNVLWAVFAN